MKKENFLRGRQTQGTWPCQMGFLGTVWRKKQSPRELWKTQLGEETKGLCVVFMLWVAPAWAAPLRLLSRIVLADMGLGVTWLHGSCSPAATERTDLASSFIKCIVAAKKSSDLVSETLKWQFERSILPLMSQESKWLWARGISQVELSKAASSFLFAVTENEILRRYEPSETEPWCPKIVKVPRFTTSDGILE